MMGLFSEELTMGRLSEHSSVRERFEHGDVAADGHYPVDPDPDPGAVGQVPVAVPDVVDVVAVEWAR